jgi:CBS-domain-containing membrane protein
MHGQALPTFRFSDGTCIAQAQPRPHQTVTRNSPALSVMTDLTDVRAATVHPDVSLAQAEQAMIHQGVRMLFVVTHMPCVDGIVTLADLRGDKPMKIIQKRQIRRDEICVADVMNRLSDLDVMNLAVVQRATVADLASTFFKFGRPHLLVVEAASAANSARIRGVISHAQIERQLGDSLPMVEIASTFAEIEQALA